MDFNKKSIFIEPRNFNNISKFLKNVGKILGKLFDKG